MGEQRRQVDAAVDHQGQRLVGGVGVGAPTADFHLVQHQPPHRDRRVLRRQADGRDHAALGRQLAGLAERRRGAGALHHVRRAQPAGEAAHLGHHVGAAVVDADGPQGARPLQPRAAAGGDDAPGAERGRAQNRQQALRPGAENDQVGARLQARALDGVEGNRQRIDRRGAGQREPVGDAVHALDAGGHVLGVAPGGVVAVLAVADRLVAVVEAQVVAPGQAIAAEPAAAMRGGAHAVALPEAERRRHFAGRGHGAGPLVAGDEGVGAGPEAGEVAGDDVRVGTADIGGVHPHQHVFAARFGQWDLGHRVAVGGGEHQRLHGA